MLQMLKYWFLIKDLFDKRDQDKTFSFGYFMYVTWLREHDQQHQAQTDANLRPKLA